MKVAATVRHFTEQLNIPRHPQLGHSEVGQTSAHDIAVCNVSSPNLCALCACRSVVDVFVGQLPTVAADMATSPRLQLSGVALSAAYIGIYALLATNELDTALMLTGASPCHCAPVPHTRRHGGRDAGQVTVAS